MVVFQVFTVCGSYISIWFYVLSSDFSYNKRDLKYDDIANDKKVEVYFRQKKQFEYCLVFSKHSNETKVLNDNQENRQSRPDRGGRAV